MVCRMRCQTLAAYLRGDTIASVVRASLQGPVGRLVLPKEILLMSIAADLAWLSRDKMALAVFPKSLHVSKWRR